MRRVSVVFLVTALALAGCGGSKGGYGDTGPLGATVQVLPDPVNVGKYDPNPVSVSVGDVIRWEFKDAANPHTVTAEDGSFDSNLEENGKSFSHQFTKAGTIKYKCTIHPTMLGTITVK